MNHFLELIDNEICRIKWKSFIDSNRFASPFQSFEYYKFINETSHTGMFAKVFAIEKTGKLLSLCVVTFQKEQGITGFFSRRSIIYGGPLIVDEAIGKQALIDLIKLIDRYQKNRTIYGEIRNFSDYSQYKDCFIANNWEYNPHLNIIIHIKNKSYDEIIKSMKYNRRREIGLSLKAGAVAREAETLKDILDLYSILKQLYSERVKSPLPPISFFIDLFNASIGKVFIVQFHGIIIGGSFCVYSKENSINTLYYCGIRDFNKNIFPTHLSILAAINFGLLNGIPCVNLMGAGKPDEEYGVRKYKSEFGGELIENGRFQKIYSPALYHVGSFGLAFLKVIR
jgi:serine/alanine adding enzyme